MLRYNLLVSKQLKSIYYKKKKRNVYSNEGFQMLQSLKLYKNFLHKYKMEHNILSHNLRTICRIIKCVMQFTLL